MDVMEVDVCKIAVSYLSLCQIQNYLYRQYRVWMTLKVPVAIIVMKEK